MINFRKNLLKTAINPVDFRSTRVAFFVTVCSLMTNSCSIFFSVQVFKLSKVEEQVFQIVVKRVCQYEKYLVGLNDFDWLQRSPLEHIFVWNFFKKSVKRIFTNWKRIHYVGHDVLFLEKVANSLTDDLFLLIFFLFHHNRVVTIKLKPFLPLVTEFYGRKGIIS